MNPGTIPDEYSLHYFSSGVEVFLDVDFLKHTQISMFIRFSAGYSFRHKIILVGQTVDTLLTLISNSQKTISASIKIKVSSCRFIIIPTVPSRYPQKLSLFISHKRHAWLKC
jgi:hypothetical protein